jgi:hypothetical protein
MRSRLWDIDILIRRTLIYSMLTALLMLVYFGTVVLLQEVFHVLTGEGSPMAVVVSTVAIAALFSPLRRAVQNGIDRRFYRQHYDAANTLIAFETSVRNEVDLNALIERLLTVTEGTLQPTHVSLWLRKSRDDAFSAVRNASGNDIETQAE